MNRLMRSALLSGAVACVCAVPVWAQAPPRYQSPIMAPSAPAKPTLPVPAAVTPNGVVVEDVVVRVNDQIISQSDVIRAQQQLQQEIEQAHATPAEAADREKNMLRDMIDQQLLLSKGKELGINADAEVIRRLDEIRKQNHFETMEDLEKAARSQGVSFEDFKAGIKTNVITQQVVRDEVGRRIGQMTQAQETAYYDAHKQEFVQPEQVRLAEILIATPANPTEAQIAEAQATANDVSAKLKAGAKFEDMAKQYSTGPAAQQGGELGMYKPGTLGKVLEDATFPLPVGGLSAPIRTRQGFVILKVLEHQQAGVPPMKSVENELQNAIYQEQMGPALRAYLTKLREEAYVDIRPGYIDSGASPKQTKPIFSAYAPPPVKKKKNQSKSRYEGEFRRAAVGVNKSDSDGSAAPATRPAPVAAAATTPTALAGTNAPAETAAATPASTVSVPEKTSARRAQPVSKKETKTKRIRREKVRFGQAPRNALPAGPDETAAAAQIPAAGPGNAVGGLPALGSQTAPVNAGVNVDDPLAPVAAPVKKTRYSSRAPEVKLRKTKVKVAKANEKAIATPVSMTAEEKATKQTQSTALGLSGDTTKKKKKRKKGDPKERLQEKAPEPKTDKFANPTGPGTSNDLSKTPIGGAPAPAPAPAPASAPAPAPPATPQN
ncbi:peptidyl-prolyl cis-trans isomerase SurA [Granulicella pectinivorans]|uniref:peptidylprolyl isomerase n=1 Tax=Granulicella pectinivorans TaxID=474950 RepID=A0A1I6MPM4_9BACT|nr:peptidylprolyl isomerase [Granulicella pectinivorans]SFS17528.1 peptidyl-prolyl cis-trans isomerase SurA [Granulicella pectinivorans]